MFKTLPGRISSCMGENMSQIVQRHRFSLSPSLMQGWDDLWRKEIGGRIMHEKSTTHMPITIPSSLMHPNGLHGREGCVMIDVF
jgi:hypothetical protein